MPGVSPTLRTGPATYTVLDPNKPVVGGQLVMPDPNNAGGIIPAQASATNVLGVARIDGAVRTNQDGLNPVNIAQYAPQIGVEYGVEMPVTYAGSCAFGQLLVAAANGQVAGYTAQDTGGSVSTPGVPATTVAVVNNTGQNVNVVITGGTMTAVKINGVTVGTGAGTYFLANGASISMTYSVAPTWVWNEVPTNFDQIVGRCTEPTGVSTGGTVARARIGQVL